MGSESARKAYMEKRSGGGQVGTTVLPGGARWGRDIMMETHRPLLNWDARKQSSGDIRRG